MATHNPLDGSAFSDETPVEWMCRAGMDSPLAAMVVRTAPVMRPRGGPYVSVLITYNNQDVRIRISEGEYAECGVTADKPCVFRATFPCVYPMEKMYADDKRKPMAVVSGWDVEAPGRIHPRTEKE